MTDTGEHYHPPDSAASSVYHNDLIRSEIVKAIHKDDDINTLIRFALSSNDGYDSSLRYLRRKVTLEQMKEWRDNPHRERLNLESVHTLTVSSPMTIGIRNISRFSLYGYPIPNLYDLMDWQLMPNLKEISIERYRSQSSSTLASDSVYVEMTEIFKDETGGRSIRLRTVIKDDSALGCYRPEIELHEMVIYRKSDPVIWTLCRCRVPLPCLQGLRSLSILGEEVKVDALGMILENCPHLARLEAKLSFRKDMGRWHPEKLLAYLAREHHLTNVKLQGAELRWLHFFRRCRTVVLPSCRMVDDEFAPSPSYVAQVAGSCTTPINCKELHLDLIITDVRTCTEADSVIEFIKINTTEQTRITITTSKDPRDSDSLGSPELELSELSDDSNDDNDSESNGHSADSEGSADGGQSNSSGNSADSEEMTPEQRKEMKRAHKAILRYAASERERWS